MATGEPHGPFKLDVPLDASGIENFQPKGPIKVAVVDSKGAVTSQAIELNAQGLGHASFNFKQHPGSLRLIVGPGDATDTDLVHLQTISRELPGRVLQGRELKLPPIAISAFYWWWWWWWCRTFTITGRVLCPDGSPAPGAVVCAYDVDWWWWWWSLRQVGCATTDANGAFTISFRWCCGWWPWWWWRQRFWQIEPTLVERIRSVLERKPGLRAPLPSPSPSLGIFETFLAKGGVPTAPPTAEVDLAELPRLRQALLAKLPTSTELEQLRVWPWWPWWPWWDCTPDIIFKVTQNCQGKDQVILEEGFGQTRWDIPTSCNVTLMATGEACCIREPPPPEGNCVVITSVCDDLLNSIGGNPGAAPNPAGFLNPGAVAVFGDRPYAGAATIAGLFGNLAHVDYYEFEWATTSVGPWSAMPPAAAGGFARYYWGPQLGGGPVGTYAVPFAFTPISGRLVVESREHFEANNDPASWGITRFWVANRDLLMEWLTYNTFADGTYYLRLAGYTIAGGKLGDQQILPLCDTEQNNGLVLGLDNSYNPALEPAADIVDVYINGTLAGPCSNVDASKGGMLQVDFVAYDQDQHLALYTLVANYGKNQSVDLLAAPGATLTPVAQGAIPAADFVGPDYGLARTQGAAAPNWRGGGLRLTIPDLRNAFPETCCYELDLWVYKRTVVNCDHEYTPNRQSFYTLTVVV